MNIVQYNIAKIRYPITDIKMKEFSDNINLFFTLFHRGCEKWLNEMEWEKQLEFNQLSYSEWKTYGKYKIVNNLTFIVIY